METKTCSKCKEEKSISEFSKKRNGLNPYCKPCNREYQKNHYLENKDYYLTKRKIKENEYRKQAFEFISEHTKNGCEECGEKDFRVLEFDHIDPSKKKFCISLAIHGKYSLPTVKREIEKCRVLCANCHKKRTAEQQGWYKDLIPSTNG